MLLQEVDLDDGFLRPISRKNAALQLLTSYVLPIEDWQKLANHRTAPSVVNHVYDLVAPALGATRDATELRTAAAYARPPPCSQTEILGSLNRDDLFCLLR